MAENEVLDLENQEVNKLDRIDTNKINIIINENEFVIPYGIKYKMVVKQPDNALSKMYDEKNELIVNLRVPTNEYKDEDLQELINWSKLSNMDNGYFRNLAIYMKPNVRLERTVVFTHAYIRMNKKMNTKADYVDIELIVNQRGDKFVGVGFGEELEETQKATKARVENPPKLNVIVPVIISNETNETARNDTHIEGSGKEQVSYGGKVYTYVRNLINKDDVTWNPADNTARLKIHNQLYIKYDIDDLGAIQILTTKFTGDVYYNNLKVDTIDVVYARENIFKGGKTYINESDLQVIKSTYPLTVPTTTEVSQPETQPAPLIYTYVNRDGKTVEKEWTVYDEDFLNPNTLSKEQIKNICMNKNSGLVDNGFDEAIYSYCQNKKLNPKVILATLGQEQGWCKSGNYKSAFGVGEGGNPLDFADGDAGGLSIAGATFIKWFNLASLEPMLVNQDKSPYKETRAVYGSETGTWQQNNPKYVEYMEMGQYVIPVNAAMYSKLKYTPWVDFPPQNSNPLDTWHSIYKSLDSLI